MKTWAKQCETTYTLEKLACRNVERWSSGYDTGLVNLTADDGVGSNLEF